jgi:hypothetical protein
MKSNEKKKTMHMQQQWRRQRWWRRWRLRTLHGMRIDLAAKEGNGQQVRMRLPPTRDEQARARHEQDTPAAASTSPAP